MHRDGPSPEEEYFHREDQERLRKLKEAADAEKAEADKKALRELHLNHCGKCGTRMDTRLFRGVTREFLRAIAGTGELRSGSPGTARSHLGLAGKPEPFVIARAIAFGVVRPAS